MFTSPWICLFVFLATYLLNMTYITVFYHRGFAHGAVRMKPWLQRLVAVTGGWVTGLDAKGWACMHRLHHQHSDTAEDPHSPHHAGVFGVFVAQLRAYQRVLIGLLKRDAKYTAVVDDLDFPVSWLNRAHAWALPYVLHALLAAGLALLSHDPAVAFAYWVGLMSHPVQGWMVNALAHAYGYRNFETPDQSRNNTIVAWLVMGEGFQNNHHRYPNSAKFSARWWEVDTGYAICLVLEKLGLIEVRADRLIGPTRARLTYAD